MSAGPAIHARPAGWRGHRGGIQRGMFSRVRSVPGLPWRRCPWRHCIVGAASLRYHIRISKRQLDAWHQGEL